MNIGVHCTALVAMLATNFVWLAEGRDAPPEVSKWIVTSKQLRAGTPLWYAANHVGTPWEFYKSGTVIKVRRYARSDAPAIFQADRGKLVSYDHGEFGSQVYWAPDKGVRVLLSKDHVREFFAVSGRIMAISGIAHMGKNIGEVLQFSPDGESWKISRLCSLPDEPQVAVQETAATFLVLTYSALCRVSSDGTLKILVASAQWDGLQPRSLVVGEDGFAYVGFSQRVAKVNLKTGKTIYLVPYAEIFEDDLKADTLQ